MSNVHTGWMPATTDPTEAMLGLTSCLQAGLNAWIETRKNGDQKFPIVMKNPALDNPFNWTMSYGTVRNNDDLEKYRYFNDTERDLTYNWTAGFGDLWAITEYRQTGAIREGLLKGAGICFPIRIADAERYRREIARDNYANYHYFVTYWKPVDGIDRFIVDPNVGDVFVVCYDDGGPVDMGVGLTRAAEFLFQAAKCYKKGR